MADLAQHGHRQGSRLLDRHRDDRNVDVILQRSLDPVGQRAGETGRLHVTEEGSDTLRRAAPSRGPHPFLAVHDHRKNVPGTIRYSALLSCSAGNG